MFLFNQLSFITLLISHFLILRSGVPLYLSLDFTYSFPRVSVSFSLMISFSKDLKSLDSNSSCNNFSFPLKLINFYLFFLPQPTVGILVTWPRIKPMPPTIEEHSLCPWTASKVPNSLSPHSLHSNYTGVLSAPQTDQALQWPQVCASTISDAFLQPSARLVLILYLRKGLPDHLNFSPLQNLSVHPRASGNAWLFLAKCLCDTRKESASGGYLRGQSRDLNTSWRAGHRWDSWQHKGHGFLGREPSVFFFRKKLCQSTGI